MSAPATSTAIDIARIEERLKSISDDLQDLKKIMSILPDMQVKVALHDSALGKIWAITAGIIVAVVGAVAKAFL